DGRGRSSRHRDQLAGVELRQNTGRQRASPRGVCGTGRPRARRVDPGIFEAVAVCDIWNKRRDDGVAYVTTQADKHKAPMGEQLAKARNTEELYSMKDIDAVIIATADFQHAQHCIEAVRAGKDVYVEKPFANIMSDAREALKVVTASKQIVQVGTQRRSTPSYMRAYDFLKS